MTTSEASQRDEGAILPMVLVMTIVFTLIVAGIASLVTTGLRYGNVVEERADRLAAADGGLRYGIERLRNFEDLCTTRAGTGGGYTTIFPPKINGADTTVTCRRTAGALSDLQGWGVVVTGAGVPSGQPQFLVKGAGGATTNVKKLRGPVYVADVTNMDYQAKLIIEDGDLYHTRASCATEPTIAAMTSGYLTFDPDFLRGPSCTVKPWTELFTPPTKSIPTPQALVAPAPPDDFAFAGCRVFSPGKYTSMPPLTPNNYFKSGDYYFENVPFDTTSTVVTFGFESTTGGDTQKITTISSACQQALTYDRQSTGGRGGASIWMGGTTNIVVGNQSSLEIFRRAQAETYMSLNAIQSNGAGFIRSSYTYTANPSTGWIFETKSGNTNDVAIHGLLWAPYSRISLGNITNSAVGQLIGGVGVAQIEVQASNSASSFAIGIEGNPVEGQFLMESKATKDGTSTSIRAVVYYRPDGRQLAVNSWRVAD